MKKDNNYIVSLRKMTKLSKLGSSCRGMATKTVGYMLEKNPFLLVKLYYTVENITFTDDILDELHIFPEERIAKPGKRPEILSERLDREIRYFQAKGRWGRVKCLKKIQDSVKHRELIRASYAEDLSPARLQAINHGKTKY